MGRRPLRISSPRPWSPAPLGVLELRARDSLSWGWALSQQPQRSCDPWTMRELQAAKTEDRGTGLYPSFETSLFKGFTYAAGKRLLGIGEAWPCNPNSVGGTLPYVSDA